jgi:hypothetical protein
MKYIITVMLLILINCAQMYGQAQTYTIGVSSTIIAPLAFGTQRNLDFGNVNKNASKHILPTDGTAGKWEIAGQANKNIQIDFTLPSVLSSGGNTLAISFDATDAGYTENPDGYSQSSFSPVQRISPAIGSSGKIYVFIGGTVTAASNQTAGSYTGSITISVQYTGN